jgi:hypothetical protein
MPRIQEKFEHDFFRSKKTRTARLAKQRQHMEACTAEKTKHGQSMLNATKAIASATE